MARKKEVEDGVKITLFLDEPLVARVDKIAHKARLSRSRLIRNLVEVGLQETETLDAMGILGFVMKIEDARQSVNEMLTRKPATT